MELVRQYENQPKPPKATRKMCEDCQARDPSFGLAGERKRRWCYGCALPRASRHEAVVSLKAAHGQPPGRPIVKTHSIPTYLPAGWSVHYHCSSAFEEPVRPVAGSRTSPKPTQTSIAVMAPTIGGKAIRQYVNLCEDCRLKSATYGLDSERKRRWCTACATLHHEAVLLKKRKLCEDCQQRDPSFGLASDRKRRWCGKCAQHHEQSTVLKRSGRARRDVYKSVAGLAQFVPTGAAANPAIGPRPPSEPPPRTGCASPPDLAHGQATRRPVWPCLPPMIPLADSKAPSPGHIV